MEKAPGAWISERENKPNQVRVPGNETCVQKSQVENGSRLVYFTALVASEEDANTVQTAKALQQSRSFRKWEVRIDSSAVIRPRDGQLWL